MRLRQVDCEICVSTYRDLREIHKVRGDAGLLMELKTPTRTMFRRYTVHCIPETHPLRQKLPDELCYSIDCRLGIHALSRVARRYEEFMQKSEQFDWRTGDAYDFFRWRDMPTRWRELSMLIDEVVGDPYHHSPYAATHRERIRALRKYWPNDRWPEYSNPIRLSDALCLELHGKHSKQDATLYLKSLDEFSEKNSVKEFWMGMAHGYFDGYNPMKGSGMFSDQFLKFASRLMLPFSSLEGLAPRQLRWTGKERREITIRMKHYLNWAQEVGLYEKEE